MNRFPMLMLVMHLVLLSASGQETLRGKVVHARTGEPMAGITVWVPEEQRGTTTASDGTFEIQGADAPDPRIRVQALGFRTFEAALSGLDRPDGLIVIRIAESPIFMEETIVTAGRREQSLQDVPVSVATIRADELADRISVTLDEPLRYVSGVHVMDDQINIRGSSGYSRGVGSRVLLLFDGIPLLTGDTGEIIWEMVPVDQIDRVEVVKGAGSALYGSSALGGVINVIPMRIPDGTRVGARMSGAVYSPPVYDEWSWSDRSRTMTQGTLLYSIGAPSWGTLFSVTGWVDESHRKNDVMHRYAFYNRTRVTLSDVWAASITGHYVRRRGGNFFWWKSLRSPLVPPDDYASRQVLSDRGFVSLTARGVHGGNAVSFLRVQYFGNAWSDVDAGVVTTESRSGRLQSEAQLTLELAEKYHVIIGGTAYLDRVWSNIFGTHPGVGAAGFLQGEAAVLPSLDLSAGVRLDWQQVSGLASGSQLDPRIGAVYTITEGLSVRGSAGTGFRYPSIGELYTSISTGFGGVNVVPNPHLKPETSVSLEGGVRYQFSAEGSLDMAVFQSTYQGLIEAAVDAQQLVIRFRNVERARIRGAELMLQHSFFDGVASVRTGYTYIDPRDLGTNTVLRFRPRHIGIIGLSGRLGEVEVSADYRYVSRIETIDENLVTVADIRDGDARTEIHTVNVRASYVVGAFWFPLRAAAEVRNLTNHQYVELLANLAPPRTYMVMLEALL